MWLEQQTTVAQSALRSRRPGEIQGIEKDQRQDGGMTWIVL